MMYPEFQALFNEAQKHRPFDKRMECPDPSIYADCIEPFYMLVEMDKEEFVSFYISNSDMVQVASQRVAAKDEAIRRATKMRNDSEENAAKAEAQFKETVDAMAKRQKELEERVAMLAREKEDLGAKVLSLFAEAENLRNRYARLVRGLCDKCLSKFLFGEAAETEENH